MKNRNLVPTRRSHDSHCTVFAGCSEMVLYWTSSPFVRRHRLAPKVSELSLRDFFLWKHLKAQVYKHCPTTLQALKEAIAQAVAAIPPEMTRKTMDNF
ncbi:uncharacterized protein TNCT_383521 [Trichonephila clavata]|uniref:Uncharacterized protein n=1 Tax=Trichonephila clavata TaxID=2740835 RepID=A0A8X6JF39_TRICU|nr:uncharacterized protein TNCT_383521 [Trichonephila clavata]